jgi:hypothetical protein
LKPKIFYLVMALVLVFAMVAVAVPATPALADPGIYYVSNTGNDGNDGSGPGDDDAWQTIQYAIDNVDPGDTILVLPGSYNGPLTISRSLTLKSSTGEWDDVDLGQPASDGITISGPGQVTVEGFEISGFDDGIHIINIQHGGSVTILDCFIHDNGGAGIWGAT